MNTHVLKIADNAPVATYGGAAATLTFWGAHAAEICMVVSTLVSVLGLALQLYLAFHRIRRLEKQEGRTHKVIEAVAESVRAVDATKADK